MNFTDRQLLFPRVRHLCRHLLRDDALADETAEDVWSDFVLLHAHKVNSLGGAEAYLRVVTVRRALHVRRLRERTVPLSTAPEPTHASTPEAQLLDAHERLRQHDLLTRCLAQLDARARQLLRLRFRHGLTQESIGEHVGVSKQYAGRVLAKSLEALRECVHAA